MNMGVYFLHVADEAHFFNNWPFHNLASVVKTFKYLDPPYISYIL